MKINHKLIRNILQVAGISIFIVSVFLKLRNLVMYGGTSFAEEENENENKDLRTAGAETVEACVEEQPLEDMQEESNPTECQAPPIAGSYH